MGLGTSAVLSGSFLYVKNAVIDLEGGAPVVNDSSSIQCMWDQTFVDDNAVVALGSKIAVTNLENGNDRDPATAFDSSQTYSFSLAAGTFATAVQTNGNFLVFAERRATGTYLEVFDARKIRDRQAATSLSAADSVASFQVTTALPSAANRVDLALYKGRAFVAIDGPSQGVYAVDLRPVFDDDGTTVLSSASSQGMVAPAAGNSTPRSPVVQGNTLYFITNSALEMVDVSAALDESPTTLIPASPTRGQFALSPTASAITVSGSYLFAAPAQNSSSNLLVIDVSSPFSPKALASTPGQLTTNFCPVDGQYISEKSAIAVHGTRAYVTSGPVMTVYELE
jgi:hypothetical protein